MITINQDNLYALSLGATMLGSGGGGHPKILYDLVSYLMTIHGRVRVISLQDLHDDDLVVPLAFVGAPLIGMEKIPNTRIFDAIYQKIKLDYPTKNIVLMPAEIGGCNALTPLLLALNYQLPVLNADLIGRAFPKINMCKPAVLNKSCDPTYVSDFLGNSVVLHLNHLHSLENIVRDITVHFGGSAGIATFLFEGKHARDYVIENSLSYALQLGESILNRHEKAHATCIGAGIIVDNYHEMRGGFLFGYAVIKNADTTFNVHYQNEFLKVSKDNIDIDGSPNILVLIEKKTGFPLTAESLAYGLEVSILSYAAPDFWLTPIAHPFVDYKLLALESL